MKGFGFPGKPTVNGTNSTPSYRADTSSHKSELIVILKRSEQLWNDDKTEQSLVQLRKGISMLQFIVQNQSIQSVKTSYEDKLKELKGRLKNRQEGKEVNQATSGGGGGGNSGNGGNKNNKQEGNLKGQINEAIVTEKPNVKWQDVSGLQNAKNALKQAVILPIRFKQIFTGSRKPWKGILLYGPPGTGKTFLAKACATEAQGTFFSVSSSDLMSKYVGESEKLIKALFNMARQKKPSIIFIDEIDSMCGNRSDGENEASRRVKTEFLVQMQGVGHDDTGVLVLGATNLPWALDPAIRRRFERRIYISLPEFQARLGMLKRGMNETPNELCEKDFQEFAHYTQNYSGSDLSILVRDAVYEPVRRLQLAKKFRKLGNGKWTPCREGEEGEPKSWLQFKDQSQLDIGTITRADFQVALKRTKPSVDQTQLKQYEQFTKTFGQDG